MSGIPSSGTSRVWWRLLLAVQIVNAVSAVGGGVGLVAADGLGMPLSMLAATPFPDFTGPGYILIVVVGGTQLIAALTQGRRSRWFPAASVVAGFGMILWIHVEVAMLPGYSFLHTIYLGTGVLRLVLLFLVLGAWPITAPPGAPARRGDAGSPASPSAAAPARG